MSAPAVRAPSSYSAVVRLRLLLDDAELTLSHVGPHEIRLRDETERPPQEAIVRVIVDGHEDDRKVYLPDGIRPGERVVRVVAVTPD